MILYAVSVMAYKVNKQQHEDPSKREYTHWVDICLAWNESQAIGFVKNNYVNKYCPEYVFDSFDIRVKPIDVE